ncbi:outer membrane beta-barrel protein [Sulfitobacter sp.]|uniref:outer membrane protein n=1 Tax=Sulfitobacter sp. TaxID=1903071 RepID=UPI003298D84B
MRFAVIALALAASPAAAQDFYGSVFGGASLIQDPSFSGTITPPGGRQTVDSDFDTGFGLGVALGYKLPALAKGPLSLRTELELSFSDSNADSIGFSGNGPESENNVDGEIKTTRVFANLIADIETNTAFTPYFGAGIGIARSNLGLSYGAQPGTVQIDDTSTDFSAQLILGTSYAINEKVSIFGDARYIRDFNVSSARTSPAGFTGTVSDDISTVNLNVGLRFAF